MLTIILFSLVIYNSCWEFDWVFFCVISVICNTRGTYCRYCILLLTVLSTLVYCFIIFITTLTGWCNPKLFLLCLSQQAFRVFYIILFSRCGGFFCWGDRYKVFHWKSAGWFNNSGIVYRCNAWVSHLFSNSNQWMPLFMSPCAVWTYCTPNGEIILF